MSTLRAMDSNYIVETLQTIYPLGALMVEIKKNALRDLGDTRRREIVNSRCVLQK
jgi:hypothetical protein